MSIFPFRRNPDPEDDAIEGERGISSVNKSMSVQTKITNWTIGIVVALVVITALVKYYAAAIEKHQAETTAPKPTVKAQSTALPPLVMPAFPEPPKAEAMPPLRDTPAGAPAYGGAAGGAGATAGTGAAGAPIKSARELLLERRLSSPLSFKTEGGALSAAPAAAAGMGSDAASAAEMRVVPVGGASAAASGGDDPLSKSLQSPRFAGARAYLLPAPSLMITRGTVIACTVLPAMATTLPGIATCIQSADVRSADGKVVLLERGTKWVGQQQGGMMQGQNRVGILWARGETPNHVLIEADSGAADALGRIGIDGVIDHHFWDRFGAAILISLISDIGPYLTATKQGSGNNNTSIAFPTVTTGAQGIMSDVLKKTLDIGPTLTRDQGAEVVIYLARDLDFRGVYELQAAK